MYVIDLTAKMVCVHEDLKWDIFAWHVQIFQHGSSLTKK